MYHLIQHLDYLILNIEEKTLFDIVKHIYLHENED